MIALSFPVRTLKKDATSSNSSHEKVLPIFPIFYDISLGLVMADVKQNETLLNIIKLRKQTIEKLEKFYYNLQ